MSAHQSHLLDYQTLNALQKVFGNKLVLLIDQFVLHSVTLLDDIVIAVNNDNAEDLYFKGQQFKGTSLQMGARQVGKRCEELESLAENQRMAKTTDLLIQLKQEVVATNQALLAFKEQMDFEG